MRKKKIYTDYSTIFLIFASWWCIILIFFWNGNKYTSRYLETRERLLGMAVDFLMKKASLLLSNVNLVANFKSDSSSLEYQAVCAAHFFLDWNGLKSVWIPSDVDVTFEKFFVPIVGSGFPKNNLQNFQNSMKLFVGFYYTIYTCQVYKNDLVLSVNYKAMLHSLIAKIAIFHDYLCYGYFSCVFSFLSPLLFIICFVSSSKWTEFRGKCAMITL